MNILFCKWNGACEIAIENAFKTLGHSVATIEYNFAQADYSAECANFISDAMKDANIDVVFSANYMPIVSRVCKVYKTPYISWIMDSPAMHLYSNTVSNSCNRIFIFDKILYEKVKSYNKEGIFYYPLGTCVDIWDKIKINKKDEEKYSCQVSFLGSMYTEVAKYNEIHHLPEYLKGYVQGLVEAQLNVYGYNFLEDVLSDKIVEEYKSYGNWSINEDYALTDKMMMADYYLGHKCSEQERMRIAKVLSDKYDFKLYTNSDMKNTPGIISQGVAGYYDEMPKLFRLSKINVNITSKTIQSGIPLRMLDIMGAGGFVISNYQTEIPQYFEIGRDLEVYESIPDLLSKIDYYLAHEEARQEIARNGYEKVKEAFTYEIMLKDILDIGMG